MTSHDMLAQLKAPFPPEKLGWKPGMVSGNRALAMPYIDSRAVMDRLDAVFGPDNWQDEYEHLPNNSVVCRLQCRFPGGDWIVKVDVGGESEQPDDGDRCKAAFSDALKRAAVKFGIGRYLYDLDPVWADWDPQRKRFVKDPVLPSNARPEPQQPPPPTRPAPQPARTTAQPPKAPPPAANAANAAKPEIVDGKYPSGVTPAQVKALGDSARAVGLNANALADAHGDPRVMRSSYDKILSVVNEEIARKEGGHEG